MKRFSASERALHRFHVRLWESILQRGFDTIVEAVSKHWVDTAAQIRYIEEQGLEATKQVISDIVAHYIKERVIKPLTREATR